MTPEEYAKIVLWVTRVAENYGNMCGEGAVKKPATRTLSTIAAIAAEAKAQHDAALRAHIHDHVKVFARIVLEGLRRGDHLHQTAVPS